MTKTLTTTIAERRKESAIHEAAHFVASVLHDAVIMSVRILPVSGRAIGVPYNYGMTCGGYVESHADSSYSDGFIDLCGCAIAFLRGDQWPQGDYDNAKEVVRADQFMQCEEDAGLFVVTNRGLIEQVGNELLTIAKPDGKVTEKALKHLTSYTMDLLDQHYAASKVWAATILLNSHSNLTALRCKYGRAA